MKHHLILRKALAITALVTAGALGCAGAGDSGDPAAPTDTTAATDATDGTDVTGATDGTGMATDSTDATGAVVEPADCKSKAFGSISTSAADVIYHGKGLEVSAKHAAEGCINELSAVYTIDGGCKLDLTLGEKDGQWAVTAGVFKGGPACGEFWPSEANRTYTLDAANSVGAVQGLDALGADTTAACVTGTDIRILGSGHFKDEKEAAKTLDISFNNLGIAGSIHSTLGAAACPAAPANCVTELCGDDAFGVNCGECEGDLTCVAGQCQQGGCVAAGDGKSEGYHIADAAWTDSNGQPVNLHQFCGKTAVWIIRTASW